MGNKTLELKVGVFLILSFAVVVFFLILLGNFGFSSGHVLYVDLANTGGLRKGAKVKVSGVRAGNLTDIQFMGGVELDDEGNPIYVRIRVEINDDMVAAVTEGSKFFVSTEGLLGEKYIEIVPGAPGNPPLSAGTIVDGEPPVELQVLAARAAEMIEKLQKIIEGDRGEMSEVADNMKDLLARSRNIAETIETELPGLVERGNTALDKANDSLVKLDAIVADGQAFIAQGKDLIDREKGIREAVAHVSDLVVRVDAEVPHLLDQVDELMVESKQLVTTSTSAVERLEHELAATTKDARKLISRTTKIVSSVELTALVDDLRASLVKVVDNFDRTGELLAGLALRTDGVVADMAVVISDVAKGEGTLGKILKDREVYDDVRELVLDLKRNPWKILWKP